jgi:hypothetical protein
MPKKLFALDVRIVATAYIKADTREQALAIANRDLVGQGLEVSSRRQFLGENVCFDGRAYECLADNEEDIALSPAMTVLTDTLRLDNVEEAHSFGDVGTDEPVHVPGLNAALAPKGGE